MPLADSKVHDRACLITQTKSLPQRLSHDLSGQCMKSNQDTPSVKPRFQQSKSIRYGGKTATTKKQTKPIHPSVRPSVYPSIQRTNQSNYINRIQFKSTQIKSIEAIEAIKTTNSSNSNSNPISQAISQFKSNRNQIKSIPINQSSEMQ